MTLQGNTFLSRTSELTASDDEFIGSFSPKVLPVVPDTAFKVPLTILQSSPGGGKTSIMRLFTPGVLVKLKGRQNEPQIKEISNHLQGWGVLENSTPRMVGVLLSCASGYADLGSVLPDGEAAKVFRALLSARIVSRMLKVVCSINEWEFPNDLKFLHLGYSD